jgi:hypothetical protein
MLVCFDRLGDLARLETAMYVDNNLWLFVQEVIVSG